MRFPRNTRIFRGQLDAAPFAGVFFLLLIFLMLHSDLVFVPGVPIQLPEGLNLPGISNPMVVVAVDENGQFYYENQVIDRDLLRERLQNAVDESRQPLTLVVRADKKVELKELLPLWTLARSAGIKQIIQATRPAVVPAASSPKT